MPPNSESSVLAATAHTLTIGTPINGVDFISVTWQIKHELALGDVPNFERGVFGPTHEQP